MDQRFVGQWFPPPPDGKSGGENGLLRKGMTIGKRANVLLQSPSNNFSPGEVSQGKITVLRLQAEDHEAQQVQLTLLPPKLNTTPLPIPAGILSNVQLVNSFQDNHQLLNNTPTSFDFGQPFATIEWGIGGAQSSADVDMMNGISVNLTCSYLSVIINVASAGQDVTGIVPQSRIYEVGAFVGPGLPKPNNAQRTIRMLTAAGGDIIGISPAQSAIFPIPRHAKNVMLFGNLQDFTGRVHFQYDNAVTSLRPAGVVVFFQGAGALIPQAIPNGAMYFKVSHVSQSATAIWAVFELSI